MGLHRRRVWEIAKGFRGRAKNCIKVARQQAEKSLQHAYKGRKDKRRVMRVLWNQRINAAAREHGMKYSHLMYGLSQENIQLNRKMLSELAIFEPHSFKALVEQVQFMKSRPAAQQLSSRISIGIPERYRPDIGQLDISYLQGGSGSSRGSSSSSSGGGSSRLLASQRSYRILATGRHSADSCADDSCGDSTTLVSGGSSSNSNGNSTSRCQQQHASSWGKDSDQLPRLQ